MLKSLTYCVLPKIKRQNKLIRLFCNKPALLKKRCYDVKCLTYPKFVGNVFSTSAVPSEVIETNKINSLSDEEIDELTKGDAELAKLLKVIILEVDLFRQDGQLVPNTLKNKEWGELLGLKTRSSRLRYLNFLFKNEKRELNLKFKKAEKLRLRTEVEQIETERGHIIYGFKGSTIFLRIYDSTIDGSLNRNLMNAALYSQHIVLDCSYDRYMTKLESKNCARQICMLFSDNRNHVDPFHIQFCNVNLNSHLMQCVLKYFPSMLEDHYPFFFSEKSYLDLYPKEKLVYLTPHCKEDLTEWNHDDIYIIGGMVDKTNPKPLSLAKAKEEGLRMAKLPLERHLVWGSGSGKNLALNHMTKILLDLRHTGDWSKALSHIPRRKIVEGEDLYNEAQKNKVKNMKPFLRKKGVQEILLSDSMIQKVRPKKEKFDVRTLYE